MNYYFKKTLYGLCLFICFCGNKYEEELNSQTKNKRTLLSVKDSTLILKKIKMLFENKKDLFYNSGYSSETVILIDSLLYNSDSNKMAIFIILKSPISNLKQIDHKGKSDYFYDATSYVGVRKFDSIYVQWVGNNFVSFFDYKEVSNAIRNECLYNFASKDSTKSIYSTHNISDSQFWVSQFWDKIRPK
jgi:hypothetical protein